jgi:[ribosomal protein S5]-alanine N-acetyltransferase
MFPILETERLLLREIVNEDAQSIYDCFSNNDVTRYYGLDPLQASNKRKNWLSFLQRTTKKNVALDGESK